MRASLTKPCGSCWRDERNHRPSAGRGRCAAPGCRRGCAVGPVRAQLLAFPQRYDGVAAAGDLPDIEDQLRAQFRADRDDHLDLATGVVGDAAYGRLYLGPQAATLLARLWYGRDPPGAAAALLRRQLRGNRNRGAAARS